MATKGKNKSDRRRSIRSIAKNTLARAVRDGGADNITFLTKSAGRMCRYCWGAGTKTA